MEISSRLGDWFAPAMKTWFRAIRSGFLAQTGSDVRAQFERSVTSRVPSRIEKIVFMIQQGIFA
jgi:hypothetical protein